MKRFFNLLLIGIVLSWLFGLSVAYADIGYDAGQVDPTDHFTKVAIKNSHSEIKKIADFVQKRGHDVFDGEKTGSEILIGLGWGQDHVSYHFLVKGVEVYKVSEETKIIFHQLWLSLADIASFADDPQFKGLKETDLFFKAISISLVNGNLDGKIIWVFHYRDDLKEIVPLSESEAKNEFSKELNWWIEFIDNVDKK